MRKWSSYHDIGTLQDKGESMKKWALLLLPPFAVQIAVLALWYWLAAREVFPPTILVSPGAVLQLVADIWGTGELQEHLGWSLRRVAEGFSLGASAGFLLGLLVGVSPRLERWIGPSLDVFKQVPVFAWAPALIVILGIDEASKIAFIAIACFYPLLQNTRQGVRGVQRKHLEVAQVYGLSRWKTVQRVVLPSSLPPILAGIRQSLALAWMAVVGAELLGAESGVGFFMVFSRMLFQMDGVLAGILLVGVVGIVINGFLSLAEWILVPWAKEIAS